MANIKTPSEMSFVGNLSNNYTFFKQKFNIYLQASKQKDADDRYKAALLLNFIGDKALDIYNNLEFEKVEDKGSYKEIIIKLDEYFIPQKNITYERHMFFLRDKKQHESTEEYVNELRRLASTCEFGILTDSLIKDRIILGINDKSLKDRLLRIKDLDLKTAISTCRAAEQAEKQLENICSMKNPEIDAIQIKNKKFMRFQRSFPAPISENPTTFQKSNHKSAYKAHDSKYSAHASLSRRNCSRCGNSHHKNQRCPATGHQSVCLRLTNMTAPSIQDPRNEMQLYCKFDMGGEDLYAVKWYKDDHEFFRYAPSGPNNYVQYPVPGVTVDTTRSHCTRDTCELMLVALQRPYSSGAYRCEVSSEAPAFRLASQTYNITVAAIPKKPPSIDGLADSYTTGTIVLATCTSGVGDPQPRLTWFVNKELVTPNQVKDLPSKSVSDDTKGHIILKNSISQLRLPLDKKLTGTEPSASLEIKCVSSIDGINPNIAPHLSTTRNIMIIDENQLVNNQKLHWPSSSSVNINIAQYLLIFTMMIYVLVC